VAHHADGARDVIEDEQSVDFQKGRIRQVEGIVNRHRQPLEVARRLVREIAEGAAGKASGHGRTRAIRHRQLPDLGQEIVARLRTSAVEPPPVLLDVQRPPRAGADDGVAPDPLAALDTLQ